MRALIPAIVCASTVARADAVVGVSRPANGVVERASFAVWLHPDRAAITTTFVLAGIDDQARDLELALDLPAGGRVIGLAVSESVAEATITQGVRFDPMTARARYAERRAVSALLEAADAGGSYRLGVANVTRARPATVIVGFSIPRDRVLAIAAVATKLDVEIQGEGTAKRTQRWQAASGRRSVSLPPPPIAIGTPVAIGTSVDATTSLLAIVPPRLAPAPTITIGPVFHSDCWPPPKYRKHVRLYHPRLRTCYMREAQRDPSLAGTIELQFTVDEDGSVTPAPNFGGTLANPTIHACVRAEVATWKFPVQRGRSLVNYPLTFRLSSH